MQQPVPRPSEGPDRFLAGDSLRACAALGILVFHVWASVRLSFASHGDAGAFTAFGPLEWWLGHLDISMYLFFVLSGYLIGRPFLAAILKGRSFPDAGGYLRNRFLRIAPAFLVAWTLILIVWGTHGAGAIDVIAVYASLQDYVSQTVSINQFVQGWSIGVEVMFYLALPVALLGVAWLVRRFRLPPWRTVVAALALGFAASLLIRSLNTTGYKYEHSFPAMAFAFFPGLLLAAIELRYVDRLRGASWGPLAAWGLAGVTLALFAAFVVIKPTGVMTNSVLGVATAATFVAAPLVLQWTTGREWAFFGNRVIRWLGARSYAIYLYHVAVLFSLNGLLIRQSGVRMGFFVGLALTVAITVALSELSFRFVEQPALRFRTGRPHQPVEMPAVDSIREAAHALLVTYAEADVKPDERSA